MPTEIIMPELGTTTGDLKIIRWLKKPGDKIEKGDVILEVETDKANVEVESYLSGTIIELLHKEGDLVPAGTPIARLAQEGEEISGQTLGPAIAEAQPAEATTVAEEEKVAEKEARARLADVSPAEASRPAGIEKEERVLASPLAKKIARDAGIDLRLIKGSGPGGRITEKDVRAYIAQAGTAAPVPTAEAAPAREKMQVPEGQEIELSSMRRAIARKLSYSFREIPHFYISLEVNMDGAVSFKEKIAKARPDLELTYTDLIIKATSSALRAYPDLNINFDDEKQAIVKLENLNISLAVSTSEGLVTPTIPSADRLTLSEVSDYRKKMVARAREGKLLQSDLAPASITISNLGMYGVDDFAAIINPPQCSILAVGAIYERPVLKDGELVNSRFLRLRLSCDHRVVDGAKASQFLNTIRKFLEDPELLLI